MRILTIEERLKRRVYQRRYYNKNKEKVTERMKLYRDNIPKSKTREYFKKYYHLHKHDDNYIERRKEAGKKYYQKNKAKIREQNKLRARVVRAKKLNLGVAV